MVGGVKAFILLLVVVLMGGCGGDPNKKANELFVEAVKLIASGDEQTGEAAIKDYEQGLANIQTIIDDYSESDLAVKLISGETLFTGKSLKEIRERVKELKRVAAESAARAVVDPIVEKTIRQSLKKPTGELTEADLKKVTMLLLDDKQLTSVKGLEKLTQLKYLVLNSNQLTDVKELENLTKLTYLNLNDNPALTKAQIDELQKALPNCSIAHDFD
jgi:hypothetical protein